MRRRLRLSSSVTVGTKAGAGGPGGGSTRAVVSSAGTAGAINPGGGPRAPVESARSRLGGSAGRFLGGNAGAVTSGACPVAVSGVAEGIGAPGGGSSTPVARAAARCARVGGNVGRCRGTNGAGSSSAESALGSGFTAAAAAAFFSAMASAAALFAATRPAIDAATVSSAFSGSYVSNLGASIPPAPLPAAAGPAPDSDDARLPSHSSARAATLPPSTRIASPCTRSIPDWHGMRTPGAMATLVPGASEDASLMDVSSPYSTATTAASPSVRSRRSMRRPLEPGARFGVDISLASTTCRTFGPVTPAPASRAPPYAHRGRLGFPTARRSASSTAALAAFGSPRARSLAATIATSLNDQPSGSRSARSASSPICTGAN